MFDNEKVKMLRKQNKLTAVQLGKLLGVTSKTIYRWENGDVIPTNNDIRVLSQFYNIPLKEISNLEDFSNIFFDYTINKLYKDGNLPLYVQSALVKINRKLSINNARTEKYIKLFDKAKTKLDNLKHMFNKLYNPCYMKNVQFEFTDINFAFKTYFTCDNTVNGKKNNLVFSRKDCENLNKYEKFVYENKVNLFNESITLMDTPFLITMTTHYEKNKFQGIYTILTDISEHDFSTKRLERIQKMLEQIGYVFWARSKSQYEQPYIYFSSNVLKLTGFENKDFQEDKSLWKKIIHPDDINKVKSAIKHNNKKVFSIDYRIRTKSGEIKWIQEELYFDRIEQLLYGLTKDITDIVNYRHSLELLEYTLKVTDEHIYIGKNLIKDKDGYYIIDKLVYCVLGRNKHLWLGKNFKQTPEAAMLELCSLIPREARKQFTNRVDSPSLTVEGPFPIIRKFKIKSPHTGLTLDFTNKIYYVKTRDCYIGILNIMD